MSGKIVDFLKTTTIDSVWHPRKKDLVLLTPNEPLESAIQKLAEHSLLSAPVFDAEAENWLGFVDVLDIVACVISIYSEAKDFNSVQWSEWCRDIEQLSHRGVRFALKPVKRLINLSQINQYSSVNKTGTLYQLLEDVFSQGLHRAAVVDDISGRPVGVITQSDVVDTLSKNVSLMGELASKTVQELNLGSRNVISMSYQAQAIHAFYLMHFNKVSAVAITKDEKLLANLSASDIRGMRSDNFAALLYPVTEFIRHQSKLTTVSCKLDTDLETVLLQMSLFRLHRIWIVDEKERPIGVVSMTDIMKLFSSQ